jgi:membrane-bound lytic murein transglycosylase D
LGTGSFFAEKISSNVTQAQSKIMLEKMNRSLPIYLLVLLGLISFPFTTALGQVPMALSVANPAGVPDTPPTAAPGSILEGHSLPKGLLDLMRASQSKYLEGSNLIQAGEPDQAREAFDEAVNMLLQSNWDIASTPVLESFFQDLVLKIQQDESFFLVKPIDADEQSESAAADELQDLDLIPIEVDPDLVDALTSDLAKTEYGIPIRFNEMVMKSLDFWLNRGRKQYVDGLMRSGQYRPIIEKVFREESIPLDLMSLAQVESHFRPHAVSKAQAKGIWQFGRGTALRYGLEITRDVDERSDPEKSTRAAARYLNDLYSMFKDWNLVLAAYNWGEGKVQRLIDSTGLQDFWQLVDLRRKLPTETKNHVPLIQASVILARNPENYGLPTELDPPIEYKKVPVSKPIDLRAAAKVLSTSIDELKRLNPALKGLTTPANYPDYQLKVPVDAGPNVKEELAALPKAKIKLPPDFNGRHKIQPGETLSEIAARYHVSVSALEKANDLSSRHQIKAGNWLQVPASAAAPKQATNSRSAASAAKSSKSVSAGPEVKKTKAVITENLDPKQDSTARP